MNRGNDDHDHQLLDEDFDHVDQMMIGFVTSYHYNPAIILIIARQ